MARLYSLLVLVLSCTSTVAQNEHCSSRVFPDYNGTISTSVCPYSIYVDSWSPGQRVEMELADVEERPFQQFLVSVQLGNSLIGHMTPANNESMVTCGNTSVQHTDLMNKSTVSFYWMAPADLTAEQLILRMSVGTETMFWKDCEVFYWEKKEADVFDTETTTPVNADSATLRLAPPDTANEGTTTQKFTTRRSTTTEKTTTTGTISHGPASGLNHNTVSADSCTEAGNMYRVVPETECRQFTQTALGTTYNHRCPGSTRFSVAACSCSFMSKDDCPV